MKQGKISVENSFNVYDWRNYTPFSFLYQLVVDKFQRHEHFRYRAEIRMKGRKTGTNNTILNIVMKICK